MSQDEMNRDLSRRGFLRTSAALAGAAAVSQWLPRSAAADVVKRTAVDQVTLGNTGLKLSRLGMGTGSENGRTQLALGKDGFIKLIRYAYDKGITYFDTSDVYESMAYMPEAIKGLPREKLFIQSKISRRPTDVVAAIDKERKRLNTDYIDSMLIHSQTTADWTSLDIWKKVMDGFNEAKEKKMILAKGSSCHNIPALTAAANSDFHDTHLVRMNPQGKYVDGPSGGGYVATTTYPIEPVLEQIKVMKSKGHGVIGMKILGNGLFTKPEDREKSIRFAMSCRDIDAVAMGFKSSAEIDEAIERMNRALADLA